MEASPLDTGLITLYQGTTHEFTEIDVTRGKAIKDFGRGFYATANREHAVRLALRSRRIEEERLIRIGEKRGLQEYVYAYKFDMKSLESLNCKKFEPADREWLRFIILNRTNETLRHDYDVMVGPTANDNTRTAIRTVINAADGNIQRDEALDLLLLMLEPNILPVRYYFGTPRPSKLLSFKDRSLVK
jgi:hypothetical protein